MEKILEGTLQYIPDLKGAKIKAVLPGIVKSKGSVDIYDPESDFHKRDYSGIEEQQVGWIDHACMKLFYGVENAKQLLGKIQDHFKANEVINTHLFPAIAQNVPEKEGAVEVRNAIRTHIRRNFTPEELNSEPKYIAVIADITKTMRAKAAMVANKFSDTVSRHINQRVPSLYTERTSIDIKEVNSPLGVIPKGSNTKIEVADKGRLVRKSPLPPIVVEPEVRKSFSNMSKKSSGFVHKIRNEASSLSLSRGEEDGDVRIQAIENRINNAFELLNITSHAKRKAIPFQERLFVQAMRNGLVSNAK